MSIEEFKKSLEYNDFAVGDTFWIDGIEFEVVTKKRKDFK